MRIVSSLVELDGGQAYALGSPLLDLLCQRLVRQRVVREYMRRTKLSERSDKVVDVGSAIFSTRDTVSGGDRHGHTCSEQS